MTEALSNTLQEIYDGLPVLPKMPILDVIMPITKESNSVNTWDEMIYIPAEVEQYVFNGVEFAGVSTTTIEFSYDALMDDGGATCTVTKSFGNCAQIRPNVVAIQTAYGTTSIFTTHHCLRTYLVRDRTGMIRPIAAHHAPTYRHDLLSAKCLNNQDIV